MLDCKYPKGLEEVVRPVKVYTEKAAATGRKLEIIIGVPDEDVMKRFLQLPSWQSLPSVCELDTAKANQMQASVWAPSYTKGHQDKEVQAVHNKGKRALVWTVDVPGKIKEFVYEAAFDGLCTNRPTMAAYYCYAKQ